jgi:hypothetical protein
MTTRAQLIHLLEDGISGCYVARCCVSRGQSSESKAAFPHELNALRGGSYGLIVPAQSAQQETGAVKHRQILRFRV